MARGNNQADFATGSGSINPFDPPRQMNAAANSLIGMMLQIQRKRNERQRAAEIGVWQGMTSRWLLTALPKLQLTLVDPFATGGSEGNPGWQDSFAGVAQQQIDRQYEIVQGIEQAFAPRAQIIRECSVPAAARIVDRSLDLVFIDAAHDYESVKADIAAWRSKVRPGGWLSGHDYKPTGTGLYGANVGRAVDEFRDATGWTLEVRLGKVWAFLVP